MIPLDGLRACRNPDCRALLRVEEGFYLKGRRADGSARREMVCKACRKEVERERYARLDAEAMERRRARGAAAARRARRRRGMRARHRWEKTLVPIGPFREWLAVAVRRDSVVAVADRAGVDEAFVRTLLGRRLEVVGHGTAARGRRYARRMVTLGVVERILEAEDDGTRVEALYDLIEVERIRLGKGPIRARERSDRARRQPRVGGRFAPAV